MERSGGVRRTIDCPEMQYVIHLVTFQCEFLFLVILCYNLAGYKV